MRDAISPVVRRITATIAGSALTALLAAGGSAAAQEHPPAVNGPAFSLSAAEIASSKTPPEITLTFRQVDHLDFRVYRVNDALAFFQRLRDPHALGSEEPLVPTELTWLERIASWKASMRERVRQFGRAQLSYEYRATYHARQSARQVARRQVLRYNAFAQVPVLNAQQLVSSWREILPRVRDAEVRRIPVGVREPGVFVVEAVSPPLKAYTVVIVSDLAMVTKTAPGQMLVYVANRFTGEPAGGCNAEAIADQHVVGTGATDNDGTWDVRLPEISGDDVVAVARCGTNVAATDPGAWALQGKARELLGYIYTDKSIYRPGHTVHIKAVLRWRARNRLAGFDRPRVEVVVADSNEKPIFRQSRPVDEFGAVHASIQVPAGAPLGYYTVRINSDDDQVSDEFEVQEYRKPEFEVKVSPAARFIRQGAPAAFEVSGRYYFGQPVPGARVQYSVHRRPYYSPLYWSDGEDDEEMSGRWWYYGDETIQGTARLDAEGKARIEIPSMADERGRDYSVHLEARVTDASSLEVSGSGVTNATYGRFLLVARLDKYLYLAGSNASLRVRALGYDGVPKSGLQLTVALERLAYRPNQSGEPNATRLDSATVTTDDEGRATWEAKVPASPGSYRLRVEAADQDRQVHEDAELWVPGPEMRAGFVPDTEYLELLADRPSYRPGDTARLSLRGAARDAHVLVTKETQDVTYAHVSLVQVGGTIEVPITEDDIGDTWVGVAFLQDDRLHQAERRVKVPARSRQLQVNVLAASSVSRPGQPGRFSIKVTDADGRPARAQLSVGVIDEAVYGVKPDDTPDPLRFFYRHDYSRVSTQFSRQYWFIGYSGRQELLLAQRRRPLTLADFKADRPAQPQVRKEFPDAIYWAGDLTTGADGLAEVDVAYPDSLTTWRLTARAITADTLVGAAIARTTTTKDLIARVVAPRFLTQGDEAAVPLVVHNYLPSAKAVEVSFDAAGVTVSGDAKASPATLTIPQNGEARIDWRVSADRVGTATFTGTAKTDVDADAVAVSLPVAPYGLRREAGTSGVIVGAAERSAELRVPDTANPAAGTIRVSLAPSLAGSILSALDFLTSYPYGCTEQTLSGFLPNLIVLRALGQLGLPVTERLNALDRQVSQGLQRLYDYQHEDGGWGWWKTDESSPFMTAYALDGLVEASHAGYKVDDWRIRRGGRALARLYATYPRAIPDLKAYLAYVAANAASTGSDSPNASRETALDVKAAIDELWVARDRLSPHGAALLLLVIDARRDPRGNELARWLEGEAATRGELSWWTVKGDPLLEDVGDSSVEATAFAVRALVARNPRNPMVERAVRWLLLNRKFGTYWASTKQTAMALYGLLDYMRARSEGTGQSTVGVYVNGKLAATKVFDKSSLASPEPASVDVPAVAGANAVRLVAHGDGTVYWSASAVYFEQAGRFDRTGTRKLALAREYYTLSPVRQKDRIVYRESVLSGPVRPGDLLLVRLTAAGSTDWRYLMVDDPIPAGTEAVRQADLYELERRAEWGRFWESSRREYRDDRVVIFQEGFRAGRADFAYLLKVTTPGVFRVLPAQVAPMYVPDSHASSDALTLTVVQDMPPAQGAPR